MSFIDSNKAYFANLTSLSSSSLTASKVSDALSAIIKAGGAKSTEEEVKEAFKQFEGMFISQLIKEMFGTVEVNELFGGGFAEETYRDFMVEEYGNIVSKSGGIGIADNLQKTLLQLQEVNAK